MTVETFFANFGHLADAPNGVRKLRELILQLAVQGKLVPQDSNDEPASILLERVRAEKAKLIFDKNVRGNKDVASVNIDDETIRVADGWERARIGELSLVQGGKRLPKGAAFSSAPTSQIYIQVTNMKNGTIVPEKLKYIDENTYVQINKYIIEKDDLYITIAGTIGDVGEVPEKFHRMSLTENAAKFVFRGLDKRFFLLSLRAEQSQNQFREKTKQLAQPKLALKRIADAVVPIPPLDEQKRIVAKVDHLMDLCDELEARQQKQQQGRVRLNNAALDALLTAREPDEFADHWQRISTNFDLLYDHPETIAKLRAAILQLAVQGKLVPQDPNDEPASGLLERIKAERAKLIKRLKVRTPNPSLPIKHEQITFSLPKGWSCLRLQDCGVFLGGGTPSKQKPAYWDGDIPWVSPKDMKVQFLSDTIDHVSGEAIENSSAKLIPGGALLMVVRGMILLHSFPVAKTTRDVTINQDMKALICSIPKTSEYLLKFLVAEKDRVLDLVERSSHGTCRLDTDSLYNLVIALPPLEEQKRIVAKVDQLMAMCDELESKLNLTRQQSEKLMEATVRQLLANTSRKEDRQPCLRQTSQAPATLPKLMECGAKEA